MKSIPENLCEFIKPDQNDFEVRLPPELILPESFSFPAVPAAVESFTTQMITPGNRLLVAFSGGGDSSALLAMLNLLASKYQFHVSAFYFNHNLRSPDECRVEQTFVRVLARRLEVPLLESCAQPGEVEAAAESRGCAVEEAARRMRLKALNHHFTEGSFDLMASAHHLDDQMETQLMRFAGGADVRGLAGIRSKNGRMLRPLLRCRQKVILDWLNSSGIPRLCDSTNDEPCYLRNRVRHSLMVPLQETFPALEGSLLSLSRKMTLQAEMIDQLLENALDLPPRPSLYGGGVELQVSEWSCPLDQLVGLPVTLQIEALMRVLDALSFSRRAGSISYRLVSRLLEILGQKRGSGRLMVWNGIEAAIENGRIVLFTIAEQGSFCHELDVEKLLADLHSGHEVKLDGVASFALRANVSPEGRGIWLPLERLHEPGLPLVLRSRRSGDRFQGLQGKSPVKKIFNGWGVPPRLRDRIPLIEYDGQLLGVLGASVDRPDRIHPDCLCKKTAPFSKWLVIMAEKGC